jgi:hypothetical protein
VFSSGIQRAPWSPVRTLSCSVNAVISAVATAKPYGQRPSLRKPRLGDQTSLVMATTNPTRSASTIVIA